MNVKEIVLASTLSLTLASSTVWGVTTTVGGIVIPDKTEIDAGGIVNLALLGLNAKGEVDTLGEQGGSTIIAVVKTNQCSIGEGSSSPTGDTTTPVDNNLGKGEFASATKYVTLDKGNGKTFLQCPATARGTETVEVSFQERMPTASGSSELKNVAGPMTVTINITPPTTDPGVLIIKSFKPQPSDPRGKMDSAPIGIDPCLHPHNSVQGEMTAGMAGGQIEVWAQNTQAAGEITVTLTHTKMPKIKHTYTAEMIQGRAMVTVDSNVTKAGEYYIEATMKGFDGNSVQLVYADKLKVWATGKPAGLKLWSAKNRITRADFASFPFADNQVSQGATISANLLDEYGNDTTPCVPAKDPVTGITTCTMAPMEINIAVTDANGIASNSALNMYIPAGSPDGKAMARTNDLILGNQPGELPMPTTTIPASTTSTTAATTPPVNPTATTTSLVATASDGKSTPIASIAASNPPLEIMVVPTSLGITVLPTFMTDHLAGEEFEAVVVRLLNDKGQLRVDANNNPIRPQGPIVIKNLSTLEESSAYPDSNDVVRARFKIATDGYGEYLVYDQMGNYGQIWIKGGAIKPNAATAAKFRNAHGQVLTDVPPLPIITPEKTYNTLVPEVAFVLIDEYGNEITPPGASVTGLVYAESSNGRVVYETREGAYGIPGRFDLLDCRAKAPVSAIVISYDATGPNQFAGQDTISLNFTKPGKKNLTLTTTIPAYQGLVKIESYLDNNTIPVNSEVAVTVETLGGEGKCFVEPNPADPTNVKLTVNGQAGDNVTPKSINEVRWVEKQLAETECLMVGGTFTNGMCTTMQALTEQQCQMVNGTLMNGRCMQMTTMLVVSGQTLNFSDPECRKVFIVGAGPHEGQFSLTFDAMGTPTTPMPAGQVTTTQVIKVGPVVPDCAKDPTSCQNEQACVGAQGVWSNHECYVADECTVANTYDPDYPVEGNDVIFHCGVRNLTKMETSYQHNHTQPILLGDKIHVACNVKVDKVHQGRPGDILVAAVHIPIPGEDPVYFRSFEWYMVRYCREVQGDNSPCPSIGWIPDVLPSDEQGYPYLPAIEALERVPNLSANYLVNAYIGNIPYIGRYEAYCGYRVTDDDSKGDIIFNIEPITFEVIKNK